jgi:elongation factor P
VISTSDFRTGLTIILDGEIYEIVDFQHVKPGKGAAFVRTRLKNVKTEYTQEKTFRAGEKMEQAIIESREMQYLYNTGTEYVFMDTQTYEQLGVGEDKLGDSIQFLKENMNVYIRIFNGETLGVQLPTFVELEVVEAEPGVRGDTAAGASKNVKLETGAVVQVPLFIQTGDVLKIDTRTGEYIERV